MKPQLVVVNSARTVAAEALARVLDDGAWAAPALSASLTHTALDTRDKALATELFYGTLRWATALEKALLRSADKPERGLDKRMRPHLLVAAYQLHHLADRIPARAVVNEAVGAIKRTRPGLEGFANALLRRLGSPSHESLLSSSPLDALADAYGIPRPLARVTAEGQSDPKAALAALNARPTTYALSFGPTPADAKPHAFVPGVHAVSGAMVDVPGFVDGTLLVLDPGSACAAFLVDAKPGMRVLDLCAAPGSKSMVLAQALGPEGRVVAVEREVKRAQRIGQNAKRLHLDVELRVQDALEVVDAEGYDAVLLDAPCSGLGTVRRRPEIKLKRSDDDVKASVLVQRALLDHAATLVKPGGALVYSVCSPMPAEGPQQVEGFLARHAEFTLDPAQRVLPWLPSDAVDALGEIRLRTHLHDADAFFAARLVRRR